MKITELMAILQGIKKQHGNLPIVGGYLSDDMTIKTVTVIDAESQDVQESKAKAVGIYLSQ